VETVLHIFVPESSQVHRCNGRIFDRNEDGDLDITDHTPLVSELYHRKKATYSENKIYPYATLNDLRKDLIAKCRKIARIRREDHPWANMDDLNLLKSAQLYQTDPETAKSGVTLAGILLLGKDELVLSAVPHHRTDLILRKVNLDRYDDRDFVSTNLVESYERIMAFVAKHLPDPFYLEGDMSISIRDAIFREVASNILIHREFMNAFPAKFVIERGQVRTENSNKPHGFGLINPATFSPFPKNPVIARFFREIGRADELGSGVRKLMKYGKSYGGSDPELIEGDVFRMIVKYPDSQIYEEAPELRPASEAPVTPEVRAQVEAQVNRRILFACAEIPLSSAEIAAALGHKQLSGNLRKALPELRKAGFLEYTIPDKPNSRLQKYRLTKVGKRLLESMQK
jgi:ATP-dependent DNA helicase RecG